MENLSLIQKVAKKIGVRAGPNTYFSSDINDSRNVNLRTANDESQALGTVGPIALLRIFRYSINKGLLIKKSF